MKLLYLNCCLVIISLPLCIYTVPPTAFLMPDEIDQKIPPKQIEKQPAPKNRTITLTTNITDSMLQYSYFGASYKPDFNLKVNNQDFKCSDSKKITINENKLRVRYDYNFSGFKKGTKEVVFEVPSGTDTIDITFSWDNRWRVVATKAIPRKIKVIA